MHDLSKHGDTLECSYVICSFGEKTHLWVEMNKLVKGRIEDFQSNENPVLGWGRGARIRRFRPRIAVAEGGRRFRPRIAVADGSRRFRPRRVVALRRFRGNSSLGQMGLGRAGAVPPQEAGLS